MHQLRRGGGEDNLVLSDSIHNFNGTEYILEYSDSLPANFTMDETLDNEIFGGATIKGDVSMAMGWNFTLANELYIATVDFILSDTAPSSDFYLIHNDPEGAYSIYLSSQLTLVPEPGTSLLILDHQVFREFVQIQGGKNF